MQGSQARRLATRLMVSRNLYNGNPIIRTNVNKNTNIDSGGEGMRNMMRHLWQDEEGQDLTEYALLMALVALVAITTMQTLGSAISNVFSNAASTMSST